MLCFYVTENTLDHIITTGERYFMLSSNIIFGLFGFRDRFFFLCVCSSGCPGTYFVDQTGLELQHNFLVQLYLHEALFDL